MAEITAKLIQELREKTSAGMMDCKKALTENNGDVQAAADWLRQKGIVKAASKAGRVAASGLVTVVKCDDMGCVVELNAETDFVAKNDKFQKLVADVAARALELKGDFDATLSAVKDDIAATISTIGENMNLRRIAKVSGDHIYTYVHNAMVPGMGQIGVAVAIDGNGAGIDEIGPKIAMHIAANKPEFMTIDDVDPAAVEREKKVFIESGATAGKPEPGGNQFAVGKTIDDRHLSRGAPRGLGRRRRQEGEQTANTNKRFHRLSEFRINGSTKRRHRSTAKRASPDRQRSGLNAAPSV